MPSAERIVAGLARLNAAYSVRARDLAGVLIAVNAALVLAQIASRAAFNAPLTWAEEAARIMLVWSAFLVAPYAYRMGANISIDLFAAALPTRLRLALVTALNVLVLAVAAVFFYESILFWLRGLNLSAATMPVRMAWFYTVVPFGFAGLILVGCEIRLRLARALRDPALDPSVPGAVRLVPLE